ncbi:MAG: hypothetical protein U5K29_13685 [Acidimicrobiales bacterium]|nr:hypothetical protein [Acidimicrobiales bacterium]
MATNYDFAVHLEARVDLNKLTMGDKIVGGTGIVLIIGLLFFPWHSVSAGPFSESFSALSTNNTFWAIIALLLTIAVVGVVLAEKLGNVDLPDLPIPWNDAKFYATIAVLALLLLKLITDTDFLGWGAWVNIILAAGMTYGGFLIKQEGASAGSTPPSSF